LDYILGNNLTWVSMYVTKLLFGAYKERVGLLAYWESLDVFKKTIFSVGGHVP
jgi:hypothetical protein